MKKYFILLLYFFACGCSAPLTNEIDDWIEVKFQPQLEYSMTPLNLGRSEEIDIVGLVYQGEDLIGTMTFKNGESMMLLRHGYTYQIIFIGNATQFIKYEATRSAAIICLDSESQTQFGTDVYLSSWVSFTPEQNMSPVAATLKRKIGLLSFTPSDPIIPENITEVKSTITNIGHIYQLSNGRIFKKNVTITTNKASGYHFKAYTFTDEDYPCKITSTIFRDDLPSRIWELGSYTPTINHEYHLTGKLNAE